MKYYLKLGDIEGTGTGEYRGWIELESVKLLAEPTFTPRASSGATKVEATKKYDVASGKILKLHINGEPQPAKIEIVATKPSTITEIELKNAIVTFYAVGSESKGGSPIESITLHFTEFKQQTFYLETPE
ncbi:MAG: hypothetical protein DWQ47_04665 [Acidobacteria bacterium]|nr:MAG: hypothetical protein DWQ32_08215 [Acidobacteriota bacterium]REK01680.1 MAG: hypothetical protein DWQ38_04650 [Acidobacteriota bacterium]REK14636.1 MAG: hypothetical protein DWQ43_13905 [Acidobacteriota bacterium]REK45351.1 MAG: hypothetical protein DWQ47_04665 [Acidobacteriota bacterium]